MVLNFAAIRDGCKGCIFKLKEAFAFVRKSRFGKLVIEVAIVEWLADPQTSNSKNEK